MTKFRDTLHFIRLLKSEPYVFITMFVYVMKRIPFDQLVQDKICMQKYNMDKKYCRELPSLSEEDDFAGKKSFILTDVTQFNMIINIINMFPAIIISLFVGPFIDKNIHAKKLLMVIAMLLSLLENGLLLLNCYFFDLNYNLLIPTEIVPGLMGGLMLSLTSVWAYSSSVTPIHMRTLRLVMTEFSLYAALPFSTVLGGLLIAKTPMLGDYELRNYSINFIISIGASVLGLINALLINEKKDKQLFEKYFPPPVIEFQNDDEDNRPRVFSISSIQSLPPSLMHKGEEENKHIMKQFFDLKNIHEMYKTYSRERPFGIRLQILLLMISMVMFLLSYSGPSVFLYQYVQKLFNWDSQKYALYYAMSTTINLITTFVFTPIIIRVLKMSDLNITLIGLHMLFWQCCMRLLDNTAKTFYYSLIFSSLNSIGSVGVRTYVSKIVDEDEQGRIFSLLTCIESCIPVFASVVFSNTFRVTIDTMPNLSFGAVGLGLAIAIICTFIVSLKSKATLKALDDLKRRKESRRATKTIA